MQSFRSFAPLALAGLLSALTACGGGDATAPAAATGLRADEASAVAVQMGMALSGAAAAPSYGSSNGVSASVAAVPISWSLSQVVPCPKGGSIKLTGSATGDVDATAQKVVMDVTATQEPQACGIASRDGASTITVSGAPSLSSTAHLSIAGSTPTGAFTSATKGGFTWKRGDGSSGNCAVDYTSTADFATKVVTVKGSFCGTTLDQTVSFAK